MQLGSIHTVVCFHEGLQGFGVLFSAAITAIANWLACQMTQEELELLGVSLTQLGDTILTIVTQKSICCK